jgi:hypothetical protein
MNLLRSLCELVLGETWAVPVGVALSVAGAGLLAGLDGGPWDHLAAIWLLAGVISTLAFATREPRS